MQTSLRFSIAAGVLGLLPIGASARAATVSATVDLPAVVDTSATVQSCTNNPGPFINLQGELVLGGISGRFIFRNNVQGTHTHVEDVTIDVVVIPSGLTIRFAKQPPEGGVGGNPRVYLQFLDGSGDPVSDELYLGRCVQGLNQTSTDVSLPTDVVLNVAAASCANNPGPFITFDGQLTIGGLTARLIFRNNVQGTHSRTEDVTVDVEVLPPGQSIQFPKQPPLGGVGGNPRIYFQLLDGSGSPLSGEYYLGKCVQL